MLEKRRYAYAVELSNIVAAGKPIEVESIEVELREWNVLYYTDNFD